MANGKKLIIILCLLIGITSYNHIGLTMEKKPYHHVSDGTFRNPEGSPERNTNFKWSYKVFNNCLLYTSPSPRDATLSRMPSSA